MPIETICQGCARKLRVPDEHAGKKARCPQCGMIYVVPDSADARSPSSPDERRRYDETVYVPPRDTDKSALHRWHVQTAEGRNYGPVARAELDQWYAEGRIPATALLRREGEEHWHAAAEIYSDLASRRRGISERDNPFAERAAPLVISNPFATSSTRPLLPHRGGVILTLGILGWALCFVFGPFAWAMGQSDMREMRAGRMDPAGMSLTQAGMVLGIIQSILLFVVLAIWCLGVLA